MSRDVWDKIPEYQWANDARRSGLYPYLRPFDETEGPEAVFEGRRVVMLGSNNYLGLTTHPKAIEGAIAALKRFGTSLTGSRFVNGTTRLHIEFEERLADFLGREAAVVFSAGYHVNLAVGSALLRYGDVALVDRNVHASIYEGVRLGVASGARMLRFRHNAPDSLEKHLSRLREEERPMVFLDGVFSAEGSLANLPAFLPVVRAGGARWMVDDAHGFGVLGPGGRGTAHHFGLGDQVDLIGGTFSKALASVGGFLVGDEEVLDYIMHRASSFTFAASAAPASVGAAMAAFQVMQDEAWRIDKLRENYRYMAEELRTLGFRIGPTESAVIPVHIGEDMTTLLVWRDLLEEFGIYTNPFVSPAVAPGEALIRSSYMATHERTHLDRALEGFAAVGRRHGVI